MWGAIIGGVASGLIGSSASKKASGQQAASAAAATEEERRQFDLSREDLRPYRETGTASLMRLADLLGISTPESRAGQAGLVAPTREQFTTTTRPILGEGYTEPGTGAWRQRVSVPGGTEFDEVGYNNALAEYNAGLTETGATPEGFGSLTEDYNFEADPGAAFRQSEGEKLIDRRASASGNRLSPATQKALLRFTSDLASQEFNTGFNRDLATKTSKFNMLSGVAGTGQNAVNTGVAAGADTAGNVGNYLTQAGNAQAAGTVGSANAWTSGINNALNYFQSQQMLDKFLKGGSTPTVNSYGFN